jgi:3'-5' exoribonuclease
MSRQARAPVQAELHTLTPGTYADCFAVLTERQRGVTRDGKPYFTCRFRDAQRAVTCMVWADSPHYDDCLAHWQEGQVYKLRCVYEEHDRYGPQIELQAIRPVTDQDRAAGLDPGRLVESSRFPPEKSLAQLKELVEGEFQDASLKRLVLTLLDRYAAPLQELPLSENRAFPFRGGWLEHALSVARTSLKLTDHYRQHYPELKPPLNRDLILAGAVLHDLGRVAELTPSLAGTQPTIPGRLFGHLILGRDLVRDAARELGVAPELAQLLEHLVLTWLALPEWGSPRLPLIPEAIVLHHAIDLDVKLEAYVRCLTRDTGPGPFTARDPLLGRALLKDRTV